MEVFTSAGADHLLALRADGMVLSWGTGLVGQLGRVGTRMNDPEHTQLTPAAVPFKRTRAVKASSKIVDVACGIFDSFARTVDGHIFAWGLNNYGQLGFKSQVGARLQGCSILGFLPCCPAQDPDKRILLAKALKFVPS